MFHYFNNDCDEVLPVGGIVKVQLPREPEFSSVTLQ